MLEDSSDNRQEVVKKSWGTPGALFLGLGAYFLPSVALIFLAPGVSSLLLSPNIENFVYVAIFEALVIGIIFVFVRTYGLRLKDIGLSRFKVSSLWLVLLGFFVYFAVSVAMSSAFSLFVNYDPNQAQDVGFNSPQGVEIIMAFVALVVLAPLAEELLFRGFVFHGIRKRLHYWPTAVVVSFLFAVVHGQINVGLDVFALSMVLCWLREKTGSLWPGIILHALKNGLAFLLLFVFKVV